MRILLVAAMVTLLVGPAYAQAHMQQPGKQAAPKSRQQIEADREAEKAYRKSLGNIPDQGPSDPWGNMRGESPPKAVTSASPVERGKTGNRAN